MCGILSYITKHGRGPDLRLLRDIALITQSRGEHAFGLAWLDSSGSGKIGTWKRPGPAMDHLDALDQCRDAQVMVGHCRWATHGSPADNANNHPHTAGRGVIVHNGVVRDHIGLARQYGLLQRTQCDSEVLGLLLPKMAGKLVRRGAELASVAGGNMAVMGVWRNPTRLLVVRDVRPVHYGETADGFYFASLPQGLPGKVYSLKDERTHVLTFADGKCWSETAAIERSQARWVPVVADERRAQRTLF